MSEQLVALLAALEADHPVVVVGQSYGGLLCSAHAAQMGDRVRALVQVDPSVDRPDPIVDASLGSVAAVAKVVNLLAWLRLPEPIFSPASRDLPQAEAAELRRSAFRSSASLRAARAELALMSQVREAALRAADQPRLVISAGEHSEPASAIMRRKGSGRRARAVVERMQRSHRLTAQRGVGSRWEELPHTHGGLVFTRSGSHDTAASILDFVAGSTPRT